MAKKTNVKRITVCAALSAVGVVILYLGSLISVMDISMAVIASICCIIAVIEYGRSASWSVYAVTSILAVFILPTNTAAWMFLLFFGYYPIIKEKLERRKKLISRILKELIFNFALAVMLVASRFLLAGNIREPWYIYLAIVILAEIAFPIYDMALTRVISFYIFKIRPRFKLK